MKIGGLLLLSGLKPEIMVGQKTEGERAYPLPSPLSRWIILKKVHLLSATQKG